MNDRPLLVDAQAVLDPVGGVVTPGSVLVVRAGGGVGVGGEGEGGARPRPPEEREVVGLPRVLACGEPGAVRGHPMAEGARVVARPGCVVMPAMVNAHTHLDLTHVGPRGYAREAGFAAWLDTVRRSRAVDEVEIRSSVRRGVELGRAGGVVALGDIGGAVSGRPSLVAFDELRRSGVLGVSYVEFFAIGLMEERSLRVLDEVVGRAVEEYGMGDGGRGVGGARLGLQPHGPGTVSLRGYARAVELAGRWGLPLSTHLAESEEEGLFVREGRGAQADFLRGIGILDDRVPEGYGQGRHPVQHVRGYLERAGSIGPSVVAHVNDADDAAIGTLARTGTAVAYCPRASWYFGAHERFGAHRYREMLEAGVCVALGTDSLINLPECAADPERGGMSVLDEVRFLHRRDGADARTLLRMATVNGASALGLDPRLFGLLDEGGVGACGREVAGLVAVWVEGGSGGADDVFASVARSEGGVELLAGPVFLSGNNECR